MKACPYCAEQIQDAAIVCRYCNRELLSVASTPPPENKASAPPPLATKVNFNPKVNVNPQVAKGCGIGCVGIVVLLLLARFCVPDRPRGSTRSRSVSTPAPTPVEKKGEDPMMAYIMCEDFVKDRLKAPSTADFGGYFNSQVTTLSLNHFAVKGYVDSSNSFGAMIRSQFFCDISYAGGDKWTVANIAID